jgi:RHS repeat-associated protein
MFRKGMLLKKRTTTTCVLARALVITQLVAGLPALAAPQDRVAPPPPAAADPSAPPGSQAKEEARRPPNRTVPSVGPPPTVATLSAVPTDAELTRTRIFSEPLIPMTRPTSTTENAALSRAIRQYANGGNTEKVAPLLAFLAAYPQSAWRPSLLANLGTVYRGTGYIGRALNAWEQAWNEAKRETEFRSKAVADFAVGEYLEQSAKIGRADELSSKLAEIGNRSVTGRAAQQISMAREALSILKEHHEEAAPSGPMALEAILGYSAVSKHNTYTLNPLLQRYHAMPSGTTLRELQTLGKAVGLDYQMVSRPRNAALPIPSVIHWKVDHYSAVLKEENGHYLVIDPVLGGEKWLTADALNEETSGYLLAPKAAVDDRWRIVDREEGEKVVGHCTPGAPDDTDPGPPPPDDNPGPPPGDTDPAPPQGDTDSGPPPGDTDDGQPPPPDCGMARYSLLRMPASLRLRDTPLRCHSPVGPATSFTLTYNQRDSSQPQVFSSGNVGPKWTFDWLSWVVDNPDFSVDVQADVVLRGGGGEHYATSSPTGTYPAHWRSRAVLAKVSANPVRYERRLRNGGVEVFSQSDGVITSGRHIYLTDVIDPQGLSLHLTYDANLRMVAVTDAIGLVTVLSYELASDQTKVTKVTDPYGRFATMTYNASGQLTSITDVIGMTSSFAYGSNDFVRALTTPYGTTLFTGGTDTNGVQFYRSLQATDPLGGTERVEFRWSTSGIAATAPANQVPTGFGAYNQSLDHYNSFYWDKRAMALYPGDVTKATITHWLLYTYISYAPFLFSHAWSTSVLSSVKRPLENRVWYAYPDQDPGGIAVGSWARPTKIARVLDDGNSQIWQTAYNGMGYPTERTDPLGRKGSRTYAANGIDLLTVRQTTPGLNDLLATYSNYTVTHRPQTFIDAAGQTMTATYNAAGQVLTITNAKSETTTLAYDASGFLLTVTRPVTGAVTAFAYDGFGRVRSVTESDGYAVTNVFDALDRPTRVTYADGSYESVAYNRLDVEQRLDRIGRYTRFFYDPLGRLTAVRNPLGQTVTLQWCVCGTLDGLTDAKGQSTTWQRDAAGRIIRRVMADSTTATTYTYENSTSRVRTVTNPKGEVATYDRALDDAIIQIAYANAEHSTPTVAFSFESGYRRLASMADSTGITSYSYKPVGAVGALQLATVDGPLGNDTITYNYDELGRVVGRDLNGVGVTVSYDALGRVGQEVNALGTFRYEYVGATLRIETASYPNGQTTNYGYFDNAGDRRLQTIHHRKPDVSTLSKFDYTYDAVGNVQTWTRQVDANAATIQTFNYDSIGQLTSAVTSTAGVTATILKRYAYAYDRAGNRASEQIDDGIVTASHDNLNRLTGQSAGGALRIAGTVDEPARVNVQGKPASVSGTNTFEATASVGAGTTTVVVTATDGSGNQSTNTYEVDQASSAATLTYDANGNLGSDSTRSFTWDAGNRLLSVTIGSAVTEFSYDGLGRRVRILEKSAGVTTSDRRFVWCGLSLCEERDSAGITTTKRFFSHGFQSGGDAYFYSRDHLGSIREVTDATGAVRARYDYDPWGGRTKLSGDRTADFGFTGHFEHEPTGLTLTLFRAYDSKQGRWISEDSGGLMNGLNLYRYVFGDPVGLFDPLGLCAPGDDDKDKTKDPSVLQWALDQVLDAVKTHVIDRVGSLKLTILSEIIGSPQTLKDGQELLEQYKKTTAPARDGLAEWQKEFDSHFPDPKNSPKPPAGAPPKGKR